jgi:hypothetical protein
VCSAAASWQCLALDTMEPKSVNSDYGHIKCMDIGTICSNLFETIPPLKQTLVGPWETEHSFLWSQCCNVLYGETRKDTLGHL